MRILWDGNNLDGNRIEEIESIDLNPCWFKEDAGNKIPSYLEIVFNDEYAGTFEIDNDKTVYEKTMENYKNIVNQLLTKGYAKSSDFKDAIWY